MDKDELERRLGNRLLVVYIMVCILVIIVVFGLHDIYNQVQDIHKILLDAMTERG